MAFTRKQGKTKFMWFPVTVSTAFTAGDLVAINTSAGTLIEATSTTAGNVIVGVIRHTIASTDDDYATARNVEVEVPVEKNVIWKCDTVGTGTASSTTDVGVYHDLDGGGEIDVNASTYDIFFCTEVVTASSTAGAADVRGILNIGPESLGVAGD